MTAELHKLTDVQAAAFSHDLDMVIMRLRLRLTALLAEFETDPTILGDPEKQLKQLASMLPQLNQALVDAGYGDAVARLQESDAELLDAIRQTAYVPIEFAAQDVNTVMALQQAQLTEFLQIGNSAMNAVRQTVMEALLTGVPIEASLERIEAQLSNQLKKYAWTYANTTRRDIIQVATDLGAGDAEYWAYNGPLDDVTRDACVELLAIGVFTTEERNEWESATAFERMYNCRHTFDPIPKFMYEEGK